MQRSCPAQPSQRDSSQLSASPASHSTGTLVTTSPSAFFPPVLPPSHFSLQSEERSFFFFLRSFCCSSSSSGIFSQLSSGPDPFHVSGSWEQNVCASNNKKPSQITCLALQTPLPSSTASPCARLGAWHEKPHLPHLSTQKHLLSTFLLVLPKIFDLQYFLPA